MIRDNMTFIELLEKYTVEIPLVQRDYAQGRTGSHETSVRKTLLKDIKNALENLSLPPIDLNFVYGKLRDDNNLFIPLDGQQRLTTLFLLHVYAFRDDDSKTQLLKRFTYRTRKSSQSFLEKLIENRSMVFNQGRSCKEEILDAGWFHWEWANDPTVKSCLEMLAAIEQNENFGSVINLAQLLTQDETKSRISFSYLDMDNLDMDDSLYIKLNARGRALTALENFKAKLLKKIKLLTDVDAIKLPLEKNSFVETFSMQFDGAWSRWFWKRDRKQFDNCYLAFFGAVLRNNGHIEDDRGWAADRKNNNKKNEEYWANKLDINEIPVGVEQIVAIYKTLNVLTNTATSTDEQAILDEINLIVRNVVREDRSFADRLRLYSLTQYLNVSTKLDVAMWQWLRVCKNLIVNIDINQETSYKNGLACINGLLPHCGDILSYLASGGPVSSFTEQVEEERIKAQIIIKDSAFAQKIYCAEKHPYFTGRISGALRLAYDGTTYDIVKFEQYWEKISKLFDRNAPRDNSENLLRRAMLSIGKYPERCKNRTGYLTLCVNDPLELNDTRSFKYMFSKPLSAQETNSKRIEVDSEIKTLLDLYNPHADIRSELQKIIDQFFPKIDKRDWRYCFVNFPELLEPSTRKFSGKLLYRLHYTWDKSELLVVTNVDTRGYNYNIFLLALEALLKRNGRNSEFLGGYGIGAQDRCLSCNGIKIRFEQGSFKIFDDNNNLVFQTVSQDPYREVIDFLK